ncbi:hypothetical protein BD770DRAFT_61701 [Pilaira anomala]|nr:hypothetical protein BD770DRAFT_61701 [Pilaira anomala]
MERPLKREHYDGWSQPQTHFRLDDFFFFFFFFTCFILRDPNYLMHFDPLRMLLVYFTPLFFLYCIRTFIFLYTFS